MAKMAKADKADKAGAEAAVKTAKVAKTGKAVKSRKLTRTGTAVLTATAAKAKSARASVAANEAKMAKVDGAALESEQAWEACEAVGKGFVPPGVDAAALAARFVLPAASPTSVREELLRFRRASRLRSALHRRCLGEHGVRVPVLAFERWLCRDGLRRSEANLAAPYAATLCGDPLLPGDAEWVDRGLARDLVRGGVPDEAASELSGWLAQRSAAAARGLHAAALEEDGDGNPLVEVFRGRDFADLQLAGVKPYLRITLAHYDKLWTLYCRTLSIAGRGKTAGRPQKRKLEADEAEFHRRAFRLVARYEALGGAGYQAAVGQEGFAALRQWMGIRFECFASPLNCRYSRFCSAFPDVDAPFGSLGSFLAFYPRSGSFEANPPFVPEMMSRMAEHMDHLLGRKESGPLSFLVVVPCWHEAEALKQLEASPFHCGHFILSAADHGYLDGAQHQRLEQRRPSSYDTAVFALQNEKGTRKWPFDAPGLEEAFREAMRARGGAQASIAQYEARVHRKERPAKAPKKKKASVNPPGTSTGPSRNVAAAEKQAAEQLCQSCKSTLLGTSFSRKMLTRPPNKRRCSACVERGAPAPEAAK